LIVSGCGSNLGNISTTATWGTTPAGSASSSASTSPGTAARWHGRGRWAFRRELSARDGGILQFQVCQIFTGSCCGGRRTQQNKSNAAYHSGFPLANIAKIALDRAKLSHKFSLIH